MKEIRTYSAIETAKAGLRLGRILNNGDVLCLTGELGSGKTCFTGGIAVALGIQGHITSPTFTIINEYAGNIPLFHFDVYRINDPEEMFETGYEDYFDRNGIVVIEWAELLQDILPAEYIKITIKKDNMNTDADTRTIQIEFIGERYNGYENRLQTIGNTGKEADGI